MRSVACLNGEIMPVEEAKISVWDRGFLFGDSVYEVFRIYGARCWLEIEHLARLKRSLDEMKFAPIDLDELMDRIRRSISASSVRDGTAYIQITRGVAPRRHAFPDPPVAPTELIVIRPYDDAETAKLRETGVAVISQPDLRWKRCDVKSTNLLANVLANEEAHRAGAFEAILVTDEGNVTEATHSSVLWVRDCKILGTPEGPRILPGTTRQLVLRLAADIDTPFEEADVTLKDMMTNCDEVFLIGTTIEVLPIVSIDGQSVGGGRPGPISRRLQAAFVEALNRWLGGPVAG